MSELGELHQEGQRKILQIAEHYQCPEDLIDEKYWIELDRILQVPTLEEAREVFQRVIERVDAFCTALWGKKKIKGPTTPESLEQQARNAESLAKMFDRTDPEETRAEKQRQRAEFLREQARNMSAPVLAIPQPTVPLPPSKIPGACRTADEVQAQIDIMCQPEYIGKKVIIWDLTPG